MSATETIAHLRELRAKATAGNWKDVDGFCSATGEMYIGIKRSEMEWEIARKPTRKAIVAAMNSLESLLECAEVLAAHVAAEEEALAEWPLLSVHPWTGDEPAMKRLAKARAALEALGKVGE